MIYHYYTFKVYPYDATIRIYSTSSNLTSIPTGYTYYVTSSLEPTITTFYYNGVNGTPVELGTNLKVTGATYKEHVGQINIYTLNGSGYFTLSNEEIFGTSKSVTLWIGCNNVKVECFFTVGTGRENGFDTLSVGTNKLTAKTSIVSEGVTYKAEVSFPRYIYVSWNEEKTNTTIYYGETDESNQVGHIYEVFKFEGSSKTRIFISQNHDTNPVKITVPAAKTVSEYSYRIGFMAWFQGEPSYARTSTPKVTGSYRMYSSRGIVTNSSGTKTLENNNGFISSTTLPWGSSGTFYKIAGTENYILPSDNISITYTHA